MINRWVGVGRLTRDPDLRKTGTGISVANFTVACNRPFKSNGGDYEADFINCVAWRGTAESLAKYMKKGNLIGVDGRIQTRRYENDQGNMVYVTEVVADSVQFLESKENARRSATSNDTPPPLPGANNANPFGDAATPYDFEDDADSPF